MLISLSIKIFLFEILIIIFHEDLFSDIYITNLKLRYHIIVSLTTSKISLKSLSIDSVIKSLLNQSLIPYKILLSINESDSIYMSDYLKNMLQNNIIEPIFITDNFKYFNKYYFIPDDYKRYIIIVANDNIIFEQNSIEKLFKSYKLYPNAISAMRVYKMNFTEDWNLRPFHFWKKDYNREKKPKFSLFAIHGAGALFPPNILNFTNDFIYYFKEAINVDDFIIKYYELKESLKTVYVNNTIKWEPLNIKLYDKYYELLSISLNENQLREDFGKMFNITIYKNVITEKVVISNKTKAYFMNTINNNKITDNTLIVSMTSYPLRINGTSEVFLSLLNQSANKTSYQCFLTLANEEFVNGEKDLPLDMQKLIKNGWVKLIWYHNIYSHKKLIPIIQNYTENDILIVDDDVIRTYNFIEIFQNEHLKFPTDIICGNFANFFDDKIELKRLNGYKGENCGEFNVVPNIIFQTARPANGFGGVLYPKHTFSDKRFFDESLFMSLSPTSDELWQYAFLIIENKILRQTSIIFDNSVNFVNNSQKIEESLHKVNKDKYSKINEDLKIIFPDYQKNTLERQKKIIVSLASSKYRFKKLNLVLESIFNNTMKPSKVVLTIYKNDLNYLTEYLKDLINKNRIETIISDNDIKSHNKYFEVMKKYLDYAIIIIKDNIIYTNDLIETLYHSYIEKPNCIHGRLVHKIIIKNNKVLPYYQWLKQYTFEFNPSFYLFPDTEGGILFPPNILNISDENLDEIYKYIYNDDIYLKYLSLKRNIKIVWVPNKYSYKLKDIKSKRNELYKKNIEDMLNDAFLNVFPMI